VVSVIVFATMLVALVIAGVALTWAIAGNMHRGQEVRRRLAARLDGLRLGRALRLFGIDHEAYLHTQPVAVIEAHMRSCEDCAEVTQCDASIQAGDVSHFDFCPNEPALSLMGAAASAKATVD